jgi:hypothetical protein
MPLQRWKPRLDYTKQEQRLLTRLRKTRKLFAFLRDHRQELFDDAFQTELACSPPLLGISCTFARSEGAPVRGVVSRQTSVISRIT